MDIDDFSIKSFSGTITDTIQDQDIGTSVTYYAETLSPVPSDFPSAMNNYKNFVFITIKKSNSNRAMIQIQGTIATTNWPTANIFGIYLGNNGIFWGSIYGT